MKAQVCGFSTPQFFRRFHSAMAFVSVPNCAVASIQYVEGGKNLANVVNFNHFTTYSQGDIDDLAAAVDANVDAFFKPLMRDTVTYSQVVVRGLTSNIDLEAVNADGTGAGAGGGGPLPNHTTYCLSLRTGLTGRSARGRFYTVGIQATQLTSINTVSDTYRDDWIEALNSMASAALSAGWQFSVVSRQNGGVPLNPGVARSITDIIGVDLQVDTQRRRMPK
jgi:hypothetical protein